MCKTGNRTWTSALRSPLPLCSPGHLPLRTPLLTPRGGEFPGTPPGPSFRGSEAGTTAGGSATDAAVFWGVPAEEESSSLPPSGSSLRTELSPPIGAAAASTLGYVTHTP